MEEEINNWFEDEKEALVKDYFKKMDSLLLEPEKEDDETKSKKVSSEEASKLIKEYEKKFVDSSLSLRKKYDEKIQKARKKEINKTEKKEKMGKIIMPIVFTFQILKKVFHWIGKLFQKFKLNISHFVFFNIKVRLKRLIQKISFLISDKAHPPKLFYTQKIWPILHFINTPNRKLKVQLIKAKEKVKQFVASMFKAISENIGKSFKFISSKFKIISGFFSKIISNIKGIIKAVIEFIKKVIQVMRMKWFPEKE